MVQIDNATEPYFDPDRLSHVVWPGDVVGRHRGVDLAMGGKVIDAPPCVFPYGLSIENIHGRVDMTSSPMAV